MTSRTTLHAIRECERLLQARANAPQRAAMPLTTLAQSNPFYASHSVFKVAISGTHSTGKTTFLLRLAQMLTACNIRVHVITEVARSCPLPVSSRLSASAALWIVTTTVASEVAAGFNCPVLLVDRPVLDAWAYLAAVRTSEMPKEHEKRDLALTESIIRSWVTTYDLIIQTVLDPSIPIVDDTFRDTIQHFRCTVAREMISAAHHFSVRPRFLPSDGMEEVLESTVKEITTRYGSVLSP